VGGAFFRDEVESSLRCLGARSLGRYQLYA
jgi:hypothetical protein